MVTIPYRRQMTVDYGRLEPVAPGLRRIHARNPTPFTLYGTGTYLVGAGEVAVIDPGPADPDHIAALVAGLERSGERVGHILVTHTHHDHSPGAALLRAATGAPVYGFAARRPAPPAAEPALAGLPPLGEEIDRQFTPDVLLADGDQLVGPGYCLTALHTPGHISDHLCFAWAEAEALFTGDHVMGWSTSVVAPPDGDMGAYLASLDRLAARRDRILYPTHGPAIDDPAPFLAAYIAHRRERERQIITALTEGAAAVPTLVARLYPELDPRLHKAAGLSVLAHLLHLEERGLARRHDRDPLAALWSGG